MHVEGFFEASVRDHVPLHYDEIILQLDLGVVDLSQCRCQTIRLCQLHRCDLQPVDLARVGHFNRIDDGLEHAFVFGGGEDDVRDAVVRQELQRVQQDGNVGKWEQTFGALAAHRLKQVVE